MRDIIFSGKRIDTDEWVCGGFYRGVMNEPDCEVPLQGIMMKTIIIENGTYYHVKRETVGQYTGILDNNGVKIFEGDIAKPKDKLLKSEYAIEYIQKGCVFVATEFQNNIHGHSCLHFWNHEFEVIGNIHDNPEILEAQ